MSQSENDKGLMPPEDKLRDYMRTPMMLINEVHRIRQLELGPAVVLGELDQDELTGFLRDRMLHPLLTQGVPHQAVDFVDEHHRRSHVVAELVLRRHELFVVFTLTH